ncbi:ATP/GTP-binding protein [Streptomyces sp. AP-93]|uniref:ATP/GTP-binding protein n=1 Tax=Streptomyces sp. AP-93 TaxID=2929048 RepID=UPI001FAF9B9C|nr:ATP/GTP-binding protein [Streptomyces sp. AP-93]MCJ0875251.1 ATP/GTP-binding protein [Streptomyces sp. AP-93]
MDLRALFSSNDPVNATEAFTNRQRQWELVSAALQEHLRYVASEAFNVEDLEAPRRNVIVLHGVGGVGKTTLSRKLEAALASAAQRPVQWGEPAWPRERILPVRIDLSRSIGTSFEDLVLTIRAALAELGRPLPAFDIALRRYWDAQHPGESLEEYLRRGGLAARFGKGMGQQVQSALADVAQTLLLPGTVGSAIGQLTSSLTKALREHRQTVRALAGCARLQGLLEAEPSLEALSFYPHLLAWELAQLPADRRRVPVILLDTFEDVGDRTHRDLERLIQRVVWLMPNAFFVITGRSRLQWADEGLQGQLDYTGASAWPGLNLPATGIPAARAARPAPGQGRQVLIGDFSPEDCDTYLARRLSHDGQPLIGPAIRAVIGERSHGLPLHLDLAVARFLEIRRTGLVPAPGDFDHTFPALIARTLSDLTTEERHVLRSVSLLDAFDLELATRSAGMAHQAPARRLTERPMVTEDPYAIWPYHLHGAIRSALQTADDHTDDGWTHTDWQRAAERALAALGDQWQSTPTAASGRTLLVACLRQGLRLARDHRLTDLLWLTQAAIAYDSDAVWEPLAPPAPTQTDTATIGQGSNTPLDTPAGALAELLTALARRQREHRELTVERLTTVLATGLLPGELAEMAEYYRAKANRDIGRNEVSRQGMAQVAAGGGRLALRARRGLADAARIDGDFPTALAAADGLGFEGREQRVLGDIWWAHADLDRAITACERARQQAEQHGNAGEQAISQARLTLAVAFTDPARADDEITLATQLLDGLAQRATTLITHIAALIRDAGSPDVTDRAQTLRTELTVAGLTWLGPTLDVALAFHHAVLGNHHDLATTVHRLNESTTTGGYTYCAHIAAAFGDLPQPASPVRWLEDEQTVQQRWRTLVATRQAHLRETR